jgi:hypothetical protein
VPEGSKPASGALQDFVRLLFGELDYVIAIFDNLLVLANDTSDLQNKLYNVLDICLNHNVVLGFKKCNIGVSEVDFFGYICSHKEYKLSDARKASIMSLPFPRSQKEVQQVMGAILDKNQYLIKEVQAYRGDPANRSSCTFLVWFKDNDIVWLPYSLNISTTTQFDLFCSARPELYMLLYSYAEAQKMIAAINRSPITEVKPGDTVFLDLRFYGAGWYNSLDLPNSDLLRYFVPFTYVRWYHKTSDTKIVALCLIFSEEWPVNHHFVRSYDSFLTPPENS